MRGRSSDDSPYKEPGTSRAGTPRRRGGTAKRRSATSSSGSTPSPRGKTAASGRPAPHSAAADAKHPEGHPPAAKKSRRGRKRRGGGGAPPVELTSHPTSRKAFVNTRHWLLEEYGPFCAYCGTRHPDRSMTLDHVAP